jgi:GT2 family glycosyltransferase
MQACPTLRYVPAHDTDGPAAARNLGWRSAQGEIIAFTDDDCLPEPSWLREGVRAIQGGLDGAGGQVIVPLSSHPTDFEKNTAGLMVSEFVTANCFYRRTALDTLGGFDEQFKTAWREDADLYFRMMENSYRVANVPRARVIHPVRHAPWGISLREQRKSMYNALLYKKHPHLYRKYIQAMPPMHYYALLGCVVLAFMFYLSGNQTLGSLMLAMWAGLTASFASKRLKGTSHAPAHVLEMVVTSILIPILSVFWRLYGAFYFRVLFL